jgi:hypothetical protein
VKLFHRTQLAPAAVLSAADTFFQRLGLSTTGNAPRERMYTGPLGALRISAVAEGGHYTFVQTESDQPGESRLDKNVKKFFVQLHTSADPRHALEAGY